MVISFVPGIRDQVWNQQDIHQKLMRLTSVERKYTWIRSDLSTCPSSCIGRFFWSVVAKHFHCLRRFCYSIDLDVSRRILEKLGNKIESHHSDNQGMIQLFVRAVANFEQITHYHHRVALPMLLENAMRNYQATVLVLENREPVTETHFVRVHPPII